MRRRDIEREITKRDMRRKELHLRALALLREQVELLTEDIHWLSNQRDEAVIRQMKNGIQYE